MENSVLMVVPSRSRPHSIESLWNDWQSITHDADLVVALDDDDEMNYPRIPGIIYEVNPRVRMIPTLNIVAAKYVDKYRFIGFMGDDHRPRTPHWDRLFKEAIDDMGGTGFAYGDDLLQGERLPTAVVASSNIIKALGYMAPHGLIHLYADDAWKTLGTESGKLRYLPNVVIEHMHFSTGKSAQDEQYLEVNHPSMYAHDQEVYERWLANDLSADVQKIRDL